MRTVKRYDLSVAFHDMFEHGIAGSSRLSRDRIRAVPCAFAKGWVRSFANRHTSLHRGRNHQRHLRHHKNLVNLAECRRRSNDVECSSFVTRLGGLNGNP